MIVGGYFPKLIAPKADGFSVRGVREVCSVGNCIAKPPDGWIEHWLHNELGWFNTLADARRIIPPGIDAYRLFAYRLYPRVFVEGLEAPLEVPADVRPEAIPPSFSCIGFDAANKSMPSVLGLECSPLSCNGLAAELPVNDHCLFRSLDEALAGARRFSLGGAEPGDYYVVQVLEQQG